MCEWIRRRSRSTSRCSEVVSMRLRPALAQAIEVPLGGGEFGVAQRGLFGQQLARLVDVAGHEDAECDPQQIHRALVEGRKLLGALGRELEAALDLLGRELAQILVDDVADMFEVDGKGNDLHRPLSLALVEAAAGQLGDIELDRLVEAVDAVVHPRDLVDQRAVVGHHRRHHFAQHDLDVIAHVQMSRARRPPAPATGSPARCRRDSAGATDRLPAPASAAGASAAAPCRRAGR